MDAVEFIKEEARLCGGRRCDSCPLNGHSNSCITFKRQDPEGYIRVVENWAKEHPVKKNIDKFREVFGIGPCTIAPATWGMTSEWWDSEYKGSEK